MLAKHKNRTGCKLHFRGDNTCKECVEIRKGMNELFLYVFGIVIILTLFVLLLSELSK